MRATGADDLSLGLCRVRARLNLEEKVDAFGGINDACLFCLSGMNL